MTADAVVGPERADVSVARCRPVYPRGYFGVNTAPNSLEITEILPGYTYRNGHIPRPANDLSTTIDRVGYAGRTHILVVFMTVAGL